MKYQSLLPYLVLSCSLQAAVSTNSLVFLGANSDEAEHFAFVVTSEIAGGESINFTDASYGNNVTGEETRLRWTEHLNVTPTPGPLTWTTTATIPVGTVVIYDDTDNRFELSNGNVIGMVSGLEMDFSTGGDNIFAYQGNVTFDDILGNYDGVTTGVTFISGFLWGLGANDWQTTGAGATSNSYLPASLTDGLNAFALNTTLDNYRYTGSRTFNSVAELQAALNNEANWSGNDSTVATPADFGGNFTVPEPASALLGSLGLLGLLRRRRSH